MEILKNRFKNEKKADGNLEIKLKGETICITCLKNLEEYNIKETLNSIFET